MFVIELHPSSGINATKCFYIYLSLLPVPLPLLALVVELSTTATSQSRKTLTAILFNQSIITLIALYYVCFLCEHEEKKEQTQKSNAPLFDYSRNERIQYYMNRR